MVVTFSALGEKAPRPQIPLCQAPKREREPPAKAAKTVHHVTSHIARTSQ